MINTRFYPMTKTSVNIAKPRACRHLLSLWCSALLLTMSGSAFATSSQKIDHQSKVSKTPLRIVALSPHSVELLYAIGAGEHLVAVTDYADYPEAAKSIPRIGGSYGIQMERLIELNPDLVVIWQSGNNLDDINQIKQLGFKVFNSDPQSLEEVATLMTMLGEVTGYSEQAHAAATLYQDELSRLKKANKDKAKVKVFYQLWSSPLMTVAKGSWIQHSLDVCGAENVFYDAKSAYPQISLENVLINLPEVILGSQDDGNLNGVDWSAWPELPAVKNQHIYQVNADWVHRPSPRSLLGVKQICDSLDKVRSQQ